ncbi:Protein of unknown function [Bacillus wiedmannii]|uniref:Uncharacterized protein n=1 Tax=Bacillus wiedmannii TaxID=1890302 RepID=A0AB37YLD0_9BACI|nr:Protein of unknown function [Bacillus wiedmannii]
MREEFWFGVAKKNNTYFDI